MGVVPLFSGWRNEEQQTKGTERSKIPGNKKNFSRREGLIVSKGADKSTVLKIERWHWI